VSPYRTPAGRAPKTVEARCCGVCDAAVGGCLYRIRFTQQDLFWKTSIPAGASEHASSTPPLVFDGDRWVEESLSTVGRK